MNELLLRTAFCCMACDGNIASEEIQLIKSYTQKSSLFENVDVERLLNEYINAIKTTGIEFLNSFLRELENKELNQDQEIDILKLAINMIEADNDIRYSEIKFFKRIRSCLKVTDDVLEHIFPDKEDYFLPDIAQPDYGFVTDSSFTTIKL